MTDNCENKRRRKADELFDLVKTGNQKAFDLLFSIYFARLNDFAKRMLKDNIVAEDIVLEVFLKVWETRAKIESLNLEAFLFHLIRNQCIDYIKQLKSLNFKIHEMQDFTKYEELYRIDFIGDEPYILIEEELRIKIEKTIHDLPMRCREVFIMSRMEGMKNKEIAEKLEINIKNVERHLNRAKQSFLKVFSEDLPVALILLLFKNIQF